MGEIVPFPGCEDVLEEDCDEDREWFSEPGRRAEIQERVSLIVAALELAPIETEKAMRSTIAVMRFARRYGQSIDYIFWGDMAVLFRGLHYYKVGEGRCS